MEAIKAFLNEMWDEPLVRKAAVALAVLLLIWLVIRIFKRALARYIQDKDSRYRSRKVANFAGYMLAVLAVAVVFNENLGGIGLTLGVAGAGIAFALQEVIVSFAGWIALTTGNFFRTGDRVQLGGIRGDVIDIGVLRSTLMETGDWVDGDLYNGRIVTVANSFVFKDPVFNYSNDFPFLWDEIKVPVRFDSDLRLARQTLLDTAESLLGDYAKKARASWDQMVRKYLIEDAGVEPMVTLTADENWVTFTVRYVVDYKSRRSTKDRLWTAILERFAASEGRLRIAGTSLEISEFPEVRLHKGNGGPPVQP